MTDDSRFGAEDLLNKFGGKQVASLEQGEYQLRLMFEPGIEFVASSPWRLFQAGRLLIGSGDIQEANHRQGEALQLLKGLKIVATSVSSSWDSRLIFECDYVFEVIADTVQYEVWEAHLEVGWVVFAGGELTLFPSASRQ